MSSKLKPKKTANPQVTENVILLKYLYFSRKRPVRTANIAPSISRAAKVLVDTAPFPKLSKLWKEFFEESTIATRSTPKAIEMTPIVFMFLDFFLFSRNMLLIGLSTLENNTIIL